MQLPILIHKEGSPSWTHKEQSKRAEAVVCVWGGGVIGSRGFDPPGLQCHKGVVIILSLTVSVKWNVKPLIRRRSNFFLCSILWLPP